MGGGDQERVGEVKKEWGEGSGKSGGGQEGVGGVRTGRGRSGKRERPEDVPMAALGLLRFIWFQQNCRRHAVRSEWPFIIITTHLLLLY